MYENLWEISLPSRPIRTTHWADRARWRTGAHWEGWLGAGVEAWRGEEHVHVGGRLRAGSRSQSQEGRARVQGGGQVRGVDARTKEASPHQAGGGCLMRGARVQRREKGIHRPHTNASNSQPTQVFTLIIALSIGVTNTLLQQTETWPWPPSWSNPFNPSPGNQSPSTAAAPPPKQADALLTCLGLWHFPALYVKLCLVLYLKKTNKQFFGTLLETFL